ncbi:MAG: N-acetyltransferase [Burkholderiaceae bacterium]|nr:MAG: N-acetyltransferase [Burkholderiaceae bacterium]
MESTIVLRHSLNTAETEQLWQLFQAEWWTKGRTLEDVQTLLSGPSLIFAYFDQNDQLVGFARVLSDGVYKALLFDVICRQDQRGTGLGRRILHDVTHHPAIKKVQHLELYCKDEMLPFYEKFGFSTELGGIQLMRRQTR